MNKIKDFNYENIYNAKIMQPSNNYFYVVINQIYNTLKEAYDGEKTFNNLSKLGKFCPNLVKEFIGWFKNYSVNNYTNISDVESLQHTNNNIRNELKNKVLFDITNPEDYYLSIIIYISGMTDKFAIDAYNEIISF